jgi:SAM-dependent methyltransferase
MNKLTTADVASEWDRAAPTRDRQVETGVDDSALNVLSPSILDLVSRANLVRVIDVGCGTGWLTEQISGMAEAVCGVDPSAKSIEIAKVRHSEANIWYEVASIEQFASSHVSEFTAAVANMTLSTCVDLVSALASISRVLVANATFVFTVPHPMFFPLYWKYNEKKWFRYERELQITEPFRIHAETTQVLTTHFHRPLEIYVNEAVSAGFRITEVRELRGQGFDLPRFLAVCLIKAS